MALLRRARVLARELGLEDDTLLFFINDNGGGVMDAAVTICDLFLKAALPIVSTRDRQGRELRREVSTEQGTYLDVPLAVIINNDSASASEMVAAFASERGLAKIVGTTTPGRLVASKPLKLPDGYFLILPVGAYVTWDGRRLEGEGVKPDVHVEFSYEALHRRRDNQLESALEVVRGM